MKSTLSQEHGHPKACLLALVHRRYSHSLPRWGRCSFLFQGAKQEKKEDGFVYEYDTGNAAARERVTFYDLGLHGMSERVALLVQRFVNQSLPSLSVVCRFAVGSENEDEEIVFVTGKFPHKRQT